MSQTPFAPGWDLEQSPFHEGELAIQERVGVRDKIDALGRRAARRYLTEQHKAFFPMLPYVFVGSVDDEGQPWASVLFGEPGFVTPTSDISVSVHAKALYGDPLGNAIRPGAEIALLGAQLHTRRRNRMFGSIADVADNGFSIAIRQTLGICPQYIQGREIDFVRDPMSIKPRPVHKADRLDMRATRIIQNADTYFVASVDPREADGINKGADVSHRGGRPGFVRVDNEGTLTAPDFVGNFIFNTLGNWQFDNRAGLLFLDFETGDILYVAARAEVIWEGPELQAFFGAQRLVRYHIEKVIRVEASLPARFSPPEDSPLLERTGSWDEVARTLDADRDRHEWRPFRIARIERESEAIRSFYLEPADGRGLANYSAGQFLPLRMNIPGWEKAVLRTYTLSAAPGASMYRISVKREGKGGASDWLNDTAKVGDVIEVMSPRGDFTFAADPQRPVVMISAGIGITPFIAMLDDLLVNDGRTRHHAPIWFIHGARNSQAQAFGPYLREKVSRHHELKAHTRYSRPLPADRLGLTHQSEGALDLTLLKGLLPFDDYEFFLCGPGPLMQGIYDGLIGMGVRDARIHVEGFGPASIQRKPKEKAAVDDGEEAVVVSLAKSGKTARWRPGQGSLLDLAEQEGVAPLSSCRAGICGTCATRVMAGRVDYLEAPGHEVESGYALICIAHPHPGPHLEASLDREGVTLDL
ncbi:MAG: pyridoxamine 5'-phosphate oxidase family protein [Devosia sp.]|uniref:2Fe-2S iron-sulfur cluster-binding protein n=1 Tax=Devosia sp. TaxID=1871048 RepID=UPI003390BCBE